MPTGKEEKSLSTQRDPQHDEIAQVARELWRQRRPGDPGSAEEDWYRAVNIVRSRNNNQQFDTAADNHGKSESFDQGARATRAGIISEREENSRVTEDTRAGSPSTSPGTFGSLGNSASEAYNNIATRATAITSRAHKMMDREPKSMPRPEHREGILARSIEQQTARIPSDAWLWAAVGSIGLSLALGLSGREKAASFVGQWAPALLIFGLYNKLVKLQGSDGI